MSMLSVVIPSYNEEGMILKTAETISKLLESWNIDGELIFIEDGSKDKTWERIDEASKLHSNVLGVKFSRNFGKESAILAGLSASKGDCCVVIDCDLQQPPEIIEKMFRLWEKGYDIVNGVKSSRGKESVIHKMFAKIFYSFMSSAVGIDMTKASDYKLIDRKIVDILLKMPEHNYFFRALSEWVGFKSTSVEYDVREREVGSSKWSTLSLFKYAISNITSFSSTPINFITFLGLIMLIISLVIGITALVQYFNHIAVAGFTTVILLILIVGSLTMISLGIIGYYIAKIYDEIKQRPKFIVSTKTSDEEQKRK